MLSTQDCSHKIICSSILLPNVPQCKSVKMDLWSNPVCLRVWAKVVDIDGKMWYDKAESEFKTTTHLDLKKNELGLYWKKCVRWRFEECLDLMKLYKYENRHDFLDQCHELEIYVNNMSLMDVERQSKKLVGAYHE